MPSPCVQSISHTTLTICRGCIFLSDSLLPSPCLLFRNPVLADPWPQAKGSGPDFLIFVSTLVLFALCIWEPRNICLCLHADSYMWVILISRILQLATTNSFQHALECLTVESTWMCARQLEVPLIVCLSENSQCSRTYFHLFRETIFCFQQVLEALG